MTLSYPSKVKEVREVLPWGQMKHEDACHKVTEREDVADRQRSAVTLVMQWNTVDVHCITAKWCTSDTIVD